MAETALSHPQKLMLDFIRQYVTIHAYPPSIRDICKGLGIASNATVSRRLDELSELGWIHRDKRVARGILLAVTPTSPTMRRGWMMKMPLIRGFDVDARLHRLDIWSANSSNEIIELPRSLVGDEGDLFAAQVRGNTLLDAMVIDGDIVVMKRATVARTGELVAVWFSREKKTMLKHLVVEATGRMCLGAANPTWKTIFAWRTTAEVQARVVLVLRLIDHKL